MKQKELSILLRLVAALCGCGALCLAAAMIVSLCRGGFGWHWVYLLLHLFSVLVIFVPLKDAWDIFSEIGRDNSFCLENARRLRRISFYALGETIFYGVIVVVMLATSGLYELDGLFVFRVFLVIAGTGVSVAAAALSHLTLKAARLKDENDLTI